MDHGEDLSATLAQATQRQIPFYTTWEVAHIHESIAEYIQALAQVFATGDMAPVRACLEPLVSARIRQGATGTDYIWLLDRVEESMRGLIEHQTPADPRRTTEASRLIRSASRNARLIISEINLQTLTRSLARAR
jgi:hypothetical protein